MAGIAILGTTAALYLTTTHILIPLAIYAAKSPYAVATYQYAYSKLYTLLSDRLKKKLYKCI